MALRIRAEADLRCSMPGNGDFKNSKNSTSFPGIAFRDISLDATFTPTATPQWLKLAPDIRKRIDTKLTVYAANGSGDVKRLKGAAGCQLRIGDWRVIFIEDARSITVIAVTVMIADEMRAVAPLIKNVETIVSPLSQCLLPIA
jgi:mRNA interferase RelE/StbE